MRMYYNLYIYMYINLFPRSGTTVIHKSREIKCSRSYYQKFHQKIYILSKLQFNFMLTYIYFRDNNFAIRVISHLTCHTG